MNYTPSKKIFITAVSLSVLTLLIFASFLYIIFSKVGKFNEALSKSAAYSANTDRVFRLRKEIVELGESNKVLDGFFIQPGEEAYFLDRVEALAKASGVELETESVSDGKDLESGFTPLQIGIRFVGSSDKITSFLAGLENMPFALEVMSINTSLDSEGSWSGTAGLKVFKWAK